MQCQYLSAINKSGGYEDCYALMLLAVYIPRLYQLPALTKLNKHLVKTNKNITFVKTKLNLL